MSDWIRVAIDGACKGNPGPGGWAIVYEDGYALSGHFAQTTNNQMELYAVGRALADVPVNGTLVVTTDSQNVIGWLFGWSKTANQPDPACKFKRKNPQIAFMCKQIDEMVEERHIVLRFEWVKGHAGHPMNERADKLGI